MDRYLTYSVVKRKDPKNPGGEGKYYGHPQARGVAGIRDLSRRIQRMSTVTRVDVMAVLVALEEVVSESLANGEIVRLGDLGSFQVSFSSKGVTDKAQYDESLITTKRILFRGGATLSDMLENLRFERVEQKHFKDGEKPEAEDNTEGV